MNTYCYVIYHILLEMVWWVLSNASLIVQIHSVIHEILANKDFTVTNDLISQLFVVAFVHPIYMQIALIWDFIAQLSLWKSVYWLWRYKLNEVCDTKILRVLMFSQFFPENYPGIFVISRIATLLLHNGEWLSKHQI